MIVSKAGTYRARVQLPDCLKAGKYYFKRIRASRLVETKSNGHVESDNHEYVLPFEITEDPEKGDLSAFLSWAYCGRCANQAQLGNHAPDREQNLNDLLCRRTKQSTEFSSPAEPDTSAASWCASYWTLATRCVSTIHSCLAGSPSHRF